MNNLAGVVIVPIAPGIYETYINVGTKAYDQHYLHLWEQKDSSPYINASFSHEVLSKERLDPNTELFVIYDKETPIGILKITKEKELKGFTDKEALLLDKIYILKEYSGQGVGSQVIAFVTALAKKLGKKIIWLDTMQKGPALQFYLKNGFRKHSETLLNFPTTIEEERPMFILYKVL